MTDSPFGRQPRPFKLIFEGDFEDLATVMPGVRRHLERAGDATDMKLSTDGECFIRVYPRAVND
jgi:hypothetical protein